MSALTTSTESRSNVSGSTTQDHAGMTSKGIHALLNLPFASTSRRNASHQAPSDNLPGPPQSDVLNFNYPAGLPSHPQSKSQDNQQTVVPEPSSHPLQEAYFGEQENQDTDSPYDNDWPDLPKYTDFDLFFTKEEYMAIALCYDIYGFSSSKIVAADHIFETRRTIVIALCWRFQIYDVLQSMKSLEKPRSEPYQPNDGLVSFHYSNIPRLSSSQVGGHSPESRPATPFSTSFTARLEEGGLAARLLQANETSLSRRGKSNQGIRKWERTDEDHFCKRHGGPSPLKSIASDTHYPINFDPVENLFQELERRSKEKRKKFPTSSSSSYETKSGYHSRSSSFSNESHIPGSIRATMEFPFGYPVSIVDSGLLDIIDTPMTVNYSANHSAMSSPSPSHPKSPTHLQTGKSAAGTTPSPLLMHKPFRCPNPNCNRSYRQENGLKYHMTHSRCNVTSPKDLPPFHSNPL